MTSNFLEVLLVRFALLFTAHDTLTEFFSNPEHTVIIIGTCVAVSGAVLGSFLMIRGMALVSDAISHTVLLGIVLSYFVLLWIQPSADMNAPLFILGAALAGLGTVYFAECITLSRLVSKDAALGLIFSFFFAVAILLISRYADDIHLDQDTVLLGEIGLAWANTTPHILDDSLQSAQIVITPEHPRASIHKRCTNCTQQNIDVRDPRAAFTQICTNCGTYTAAEALQKGLITRTIPVVLWPKAITAVFWSMLANILFIIIFYKELKIASFDMALARALHMYPKHIMFGLFIMISITAVSAFDAIGTVLVIGFFVIPPATAYILVHRLSAMVFLSALFGCIAAVFGYRLAYYWDISISAAIVLLMFFIFCVCWIISPRYGLVTTLIRRIIQTKHFQEHIILGHILHHQLMQENTELQVHTLHQHIRQPITQLQRITKKLQKRNLLFIEQGLYRLTPKGYIAAEQFRSKLFIVSNKNHS